MIRATAGGQRPTVTGPLRRPAACAAVGAAVVVAAMGLKYEGLSSSTRTDQRLEWLVSVSTPSSEDGYTLIRALGDPLAVIVMAGLLAAFAVTRGRRRLAALALVGPGLTGVATSTLKLLFDRTLDGEPAYPSGHTGALTSLAIVAALLLVSLLGPGTITTVLLVSAITVAAAGVMAVALTVLDTHYPTDTVGGFGTAVVIVLGVALLLDRWADRRSATLSPAA